MRVSSILTSIACLAPALASLSSSGTDFHLECKENGDVYVGIPYSGRKLVTVQYISYGDCDENSAGVSISYTGALNTDDYVVHLTMNRMQCNMTNWDTQDAVVRLGWPERDIYLAEYTVESYCEHDYEFDIEFGYNMGLDHYNFGESGGLLNCSFDLVPYDDKFENVIDAAPDRAGDMLHLGLREKCDFEHCSKVYAPKKCKVTDGTTEYEVYNYETTCGDEYIDFSMEYNVGTHIWQIQHMIFLMGDKVESTYKLVCTVVVCDKNSEVSECVRIMDACHNGIEDLHDPTCDEPCENDPCQNNSTCEATVDGTDYSCNNCGSEFTGKNCDTEVVDPCAAPAVNPCKNGGICVNNGGVQGCQCPGGYVGDLCETLMFDPCKDNFCENGGNCVNNATFQGCACTSCFTGELCNQVLCPDPCSPDPCQNNATCESTTDMTDYMCNNCSSEFTGKNCDTAVPCSAPAGNPCKNGGTCVNSVNFDDFSCENCDDGFTGKTCEEEIDACQPNPCKNDGECMNNGPGNFRCVCRFIPGDHAYTGETCETDMYSDIAIGSGDPHYTTFDGPVVDNQSPCHMQLMKLCDTSSMMPSFKLTGTQKYHPYDTNQNWGVTFLEGFNFYYTQTPASPTYQFRITKNRRTQFRQYRDGELMRSNTNDGFMEQNINLPSLMIAIRVQGLFTEIYFGVGWNTGDRSWRTSATTPVPDYLGVVRYHHTRSVVQGQISHALAGKVCGMWGNYNGIPEVGIESHNAGDSRGVLELALHNLYSPSNCAGSVSPDIGNCQWADEYRTKCEALNHNVFSSKCSKSTKRMIDACVYDLCVTDIPEEDVICEMMESYVSRCNAHKRKIFNWRSTNRCPLPCPENAEYRAIAKTPCFKTVQACEIDQSACDNAVAGEGCFCKTGYIQNGYGGDMECLPEADVPCPCPEFDERGNCIATNCNPTTHQLRQWDSDGFGTKSIHDDEDMWETSSNKWQHVTFKNNLSDTVKVYWLKYNDRDEAHYKTLSAGSYWAVETSENHKWIFRSVSGQALAIVDIKKGKHDYVIDQSKVDYYNEEGIC